MNEISLKNLKLRYQELSCLKQKDLTSFEIQEQVRWVISMISGIAADWDEKDYSEYLRDLSDSFGRWGVYSASQEIYRQKLEELCIELGQKIKNMKATLPYS